MRLRPISSFMGRNRVSGQSLLKVNRSSRLRTRSGLHISVRVHSMNGDWRHLATRTRFRSRSRSGIEILKTLARSRQNRGPSDRRVQDGTQDSRSTVSSLSGDRTDSPIPRRRDRRSSERGDTSARKTENQKGSAPKATCARKTALVGFRSIELLLEKWAAHSDVPATL